MEIWRNGDIEAWRHGDMDMETWTRDMVMETWTDIYGIKISGNFDVFLWKIHRNIEKLRG
jgi:hypothetical protein